MSDRITLKGIPLTNLIKIGKYYRFEISIQNSKQDKGYLRNEITYSVFLPLQLARFFFNKDLTSMIVFLTGIPTLDMPIDKCPGEIGVLCKRIVVLTSNIQGMPDRAEKMVEFSSLSIPATYKMSPPTKTKLDRIANYYKKHGRFDEPIKITTNHLVVDGYARLCVANYLSLEFVPVTYVEEYKI